MTRKSTLTAGEHLLWGFFRTSATTGWVTCPHREAYGGGCQEHIESAWVAWATDREIRMELIKALAEHLDDEHGGPQ